MSKWVSSWEYLTTDFSLFPTRVKDETQRILFYNNLRGSRVRIRFSNEFGRGRLSFKNILLADAGEDSLVDVKTSIPVTIRGRTEWTLAPGEECYSDELSFSVFPGQWISVSSYIEGEAVITASAMCQERLLTKVSNNYGGDDCAKQSFKARPQEEYLEFFRYKSGFQCFYGMNRFDVLADDNVRGIAAFGDSITHHGHWSAALALRLYQRFPGKVSLVNCGICGNRILHDASIRSVFAGNFGIRALDRFEKNVFDNGNRHIGLVLFMMGINDIIHPPFGSAPRYETVSAEEIIEALKWFAAAARAQGAEIMIGTLLPFKNFDGKWSEEINSKRLAVNDWIRSNTVFDAVFDGDAAVRNPLNPACLMPECDCGDNLHPSVYGGQRVADKIDIKTLSSFLDL